MNGIKSILRGRQLASSHFRPFVSCRASPINTHIEHILNRKWYLDDPSTPITPIYLHNNNDNSPQSLSINQEPSFYVLRDDLKHPYISGNKRRKLDGFWPEISKKNIQDVITCGGSQSAHVLAIAAAAAEEGIRSHLLLRGERPNVCTGNHLFARMLAHEVVYVSRQEYADRTTMLSTYASKIQETRHTKVAVVPEGASEASSLLGMIRMMHWVAVTAQRDSTHKKVQFVVDCGTGTTAVGLALGAVLLGLQRWKVLGIMLAAPRDYYEQQTSSLINSFCAKESIHEDPDYFIKKVQNQLEWVERKNPRKFGNVLHEDIVACKHIAQRHGVIVDPIWSLATWEIAEELSLQGASSSCDNYTYGDDDGDERGDIMMYHSGGLLGLNGVAQRYPNEF